MSFLQIKAILWSFSHKPRLFCKVTSSNAQATALTPDTTALTPDPVDNVERVLVRSTVTGFEQGIAAAAGFFTAGPLGALASWGVIRGCQGKWTPWFVLGLPAAIVINILNVVLIMSLVGASQQDGADQKQSLIAPMSAIQV